MNTFINDDEKELPVPGYNLPSPLDHHLYVICESLQRDPGLNNGATALYWHLVGIIQQHVKD